jgi:hypothetical protein
LGAYALGRGSDAVLLSTIAVLPVLAPAITSAVFRDHECD